MEAGEQIAADNRDIRLEKNPPLALILIDRAAEKNSLNRSTLAALTQAFESLRNDDEIRAIILTGSGKDSFASGPDSNELLALAPAEARAYAQTGQRLMQTIEELGKPVIAALNGQASGAGLELALACSLRLAADQVRLGHPAVRMGLIPAFGGTQRLSAIVGRGRAMELLLTASGIDTEEAYRIGLVNSICSPQELFARARDLAQKISNHAPLAIKYCLEALVNGAEMPREDGLYLEATLFGLCCATDDMRAGVRAMLADHPARFEGK